jgi:Xaa-Pro aminopeptidase
MTAPPPAIPMPDPAVLARRRQRLFSAVLASGAEALVAGGDTEFNKHGYVRYLTGWRLYGGTGFVVLRPDGEADFVLGLGAQAEWASQVCRGLAVRPVLDKISAVAEAACAGTSPTARIAVAGLDAILSHGDARRLQAAVGRRTLFDASALVEDLWAELEPADITAAEEAHAIVAQAFAAFRGALAPGRTEREVVAAAYGRAAELGCFDGIVNVSVGAAAGTHPATARRFERGDVIKMFMEFLTPQGFLIELGGCFSFGEPSRTWRDRFDLSAGAIEAAIAATRPGMVADDLVQVIAGEFRRAGAEVVGRRLWDFHGQGYHSLQRPFGLPGSQDPIRAGMMINIHPGLLTADALGVSAINNYIVTPDGGRPLGGFRHAWQVV